MSEALLLNDFLLPLREKVAGGAGRMRGVGAYGGRMAAYSVLTSVSGTKLDIGRVIAALPGVRISHKNERGELTRSGTVHEQSSVTAESASVAEALVVLEQMIDSQDEGVVEEREVYVGYFFVAQCNLDFPLAELATLTRLGTNLLVSCYEVEPEDLEAPA